MAYIIIDRDDVIW